MIDAKTAKLRITEAKPSLNTMMVQVEEGIKEAVKAGFSRAEIEVYGDKEHIDFILQDLTELGYRATVFLRRGLLANGLIVMPSYSIVVNWG